MTAVRVQPSATGPRPRADAPSRLGVAVAAARSEWIKLRSVRSTVWSMLIASAILIGLGALFSAARAARWDRLGPEARLRFDPTAFSLNGIFLAQLAIGILGVLVMTSEYATGQIRATLGATPQRGTVLGAKVLVFATTTFVVSLIGCFVAFVVGQSFFATKHVQAHLGDPGVARAIVGGALYLTVLGVLGIGLGAILRRTAGAIAVLVAILLILPILVSFLPSPWNDDINKFLPGEAGRQIFSVVHPSEFLTWRPGFGVFCAYAVATLALGLILLVKRDA